MYQFFVESNQVKSGEITITGNDVSHIRSALRMHAGEQIRISDGEEGNYLCEITSIESDKVLAKIIENCPGTELPVQLTLFQGIAKGDKMDYVIQKAVELGVHEIIPVITKNCVVKLDEERAKAKRERWQAISESAAKQSKRSMIPQIGKVRSFEEALEYAYALDVQLFPYENERGMAHTREVLGKIKKGDTIGIFIGPEGGFSPEEVEMVNGKMELISLGNRILRTETAGLAALSMVVYETED